MRGADRCEAIGIGSLAEWRKRYLEHPLMANLARRLIWNIGDAVAIPIADDFIGADSKRVEPTADADVSLWHPIEADADGVVDLRGRGVFLADGERADCEKANGREPGSAGICAVPALGSHSYSL